VLGRCLSLLRNEADAREASQEVFLKVHRAAGRFRGEASPSTFLYKVTTNHCLNVIRSRKRRPETPVEDLSYVPDVAVDTVELRQLLDHLLDGESDRTRECVVYYYVDGMTHRAIGEMLGVTEAAVRKRLKKFQARAKEKAGWSS
jgi:RNA polymerase sigma-70 factor (ECF subfamily)